jgi:hypothetical protein
MMKNIYGEYKGTFLVPNARIYFGKKDDGTEFAQMSFISMGAMHSDFNSIKEITDNSAILVIVTGGTSMDVNCKYENNKLLVHCDVMENMSVDYELEKVSDTAIWKEEYYCVPEGNIIELKKNNDYGKDETIVNYEYELGNEDVLKALDDRGFVRAKDLSFKSILSLFTKVCELYTQNGLNYMHTKTIGTIAQMTHAESQRNFTNCRGISIIFCGVLRANGIKAFYEALLPLDLEDKECHIVNEVFVEDFNKFVLFDASLCSVYKLNDKYLNSIEIKNAIIDGYADDIVIEYCNDKKKAKFNAEILAYYSKNLGHLERNIINSETKETNNNSITLSPISKKDAYADDGLVTTDIYKYFV